MQQLAICERIAITQDEKEGCEFWRGWLEQGQAEYLRRLNGGPQAVSFAQAKEEEPKS